MSESCSLPVPLRVGAARISITPASPQWLDGYGSRTGPSEGVYLELHARGLALQSGDVRIILVAAEVLGFDRTRTPALKARIAAATGVPDHHVVLMATHTHCAPRVSDMVMPGRVDLEYVAWFEDRCVETAQAAVARLTPAHASVSRAQDPGVGINRRLPVGTGVTARPNPEGPHDRDIDTLWFTDPSAPTGTPFASLTIAACHPTCRGGQLVGGDYPGFLCRDLERAHQSIALFALGCAGDVRPHFTTETGNFRMAELAEVEAAGSRLAAEVLHSRDRTFALDVPFLSVLHKVVDAPLCPPPAADALSGISRTDTNALRREWAAWLLEQRNPPSQVPLELQVLRLGADLSIVFWPGEVVADYALWLKGQETGERQLTDTPDHHPGPPTRGDESAPRILIAAYANGTVGYVPSRHMYARGGYEVDGSHYYYRLPAPYAPEVEDCLRDATLRLLGEH